MFSQMNHQSDKLVSLQETLTRKDEEMRAMEERYKRYLEKARNVSLDIFTYFYNKFIFKCIFIFF